MAGSFYKVSFFYQSVGFGWSETWYTREELEGQDVGNLIKTYNNLRLAMLRSVTTFTGARLSIVPSATIKPGIRSSRLLVPGDNKFPTINSKLTLDETGTYVKETSSEGMEQIRSNIHLRLGFGDRSTTRYLVGAPDALSNTESGKVTFGQAPNWEGRYISWVDHVRQNWAIVARTPIATDPLFPVRAIGKTADTPPKLIVIVSNADPLPWTVGDLISISGFRFKKGVPPISINGRYHLDALQTGVPTTGLHSITLREATGVDLTTIKVFGTARRLQKQITLFAVVDPVRLGTHKRGKPSLTPRGRRLTRLTLDP